MPDKHGFDHLPNWGIVTHRCIEEECGYEGTPLTEKERERHARTHARARKRESDKVRDQNLRKARKMRKLALAENPDKEDE